MKDDEAALYDLATSVFKAALNQFGERGIMDVIGGFYDTTSMTLITMQAGVPDGKPLPLPILTK
jgi:4-carboxymuconolactone decarboxylase